MPEGSTSTFDLSAATSALSGLSEALKSWVTTAAPYIVTIAGAFFAFYLIRVVIRLVRSASK